MDTSRSVIRKVLAWANVVLNEVYPAMTSSEDRKDVADAKKALQRLTQNKQRTLQEASDKVVYEKLVRKLQAEEMPITPEEWKRSSRLD